MATGRVLQFDQARGYGFVAAEDGGDDVFLHASVFDGDPGLLAPGMKVEFKIMAGDRGRKAFAAHLIDDEAGSGNEPVPAVRPNPSFIPTRGVPTMPEAPGREDAPGEEQMCDYAEPRQITGDLRCRPGALPRGPRSVRVPGHAQDMDMAGVHLDHEPRPGTKGRAARLGCAISPRLGSRRHKPAHAHRPGEQPGQDGDHCPASVASKPAILPI